MFGRSYRLPFRLLGIPVQLDVSFLLILPLLAWIIGRQVGEFAKMFGLPDSPILHGGLMPYALGLIAAIGLFVSVVIHELGHAVVARRYGVKVKNITLWFLGGVAQFAEIPRQRGAEAVVSIVGPIVSIAIGVICWMLLRFTPSSAVALRFVLAYMAYMNIVLAVFNLVPALPLDGGRVLRSVLALWMPPARATELAAGVSKVLAVLLGLLGLISFNFFLLLIAIFIFMAVRSETVTGQVEQLLRGFTVGEVMNADVHTISPKVPIAELTDRMFRERRLAFPVIDGEGKLLGLVSVEQLHGQDPATPVGKLANRAMTIRQDAPAIEAFRQMSENGFGRIIVIDESSRPVGIITKTDLLRLLQLREAGLRRHEAPSFHPHPVHPVQPA